MSPENDHTPSPPVYIVSDSDILRDLTPEQRARVEASISWAEYPAGHLFYAPEDEGELIYFLRRGRVRIYKLSLEGRALTLLILEPVAIFGEMALAEEWRHDTFAESTTSCTVGALRRGELRELLSAHPTIAMRFMSVMTIRLRALEQKLADIAFKSVPQRLAEVLLWMASQPGQPPDQAPAMVRYTHQQLAEMIGSYRETVTKTIGDFREARMIRIEEDAIFLTDVARLRALAGGKV